MATKIEGLEIPLICINAYQPNFVKNDGCEEILLCFSFRESMFNQYVNGNSKCLLI